MSRSDGPGAALRVYIDESDHWEGKPLFEALVEAARKAGMRGATVLRGIEGYGADAHIHTSRILRLSESLPVVVEIVDSVERVEEFLATIDAMVEEGVVTVTPVRVVAYRRGDEKA